MHSVAHELMFSIPCVSIVLLFFAAFSGGCRQTLPRSAAQQEPVRNVATSASVVVHASSQQGEAPSPNAQRATQKGSHSSGEPNLQDVEEREGPFTFGGQGFTVVLHNKRIPGKQGNFAQALASELKSVGITLDYAPVLDIHTNPKNPVIGDRALAETADHVARLGAAIVRALQGEGIAACGKHFPGHGDTSTDSHVELPLVEHPPARLREVEFAPFRAAIEAGVATIMTAHVLVPALDEQRPASLSRAIVHDLLREELNYDGVILSDDLEMKAIAATYEVPSAAVQAIQAGCDGVLICSGHHDTQAAALEAIIHAVEEERLPLTRVNDALIRQRRAKERFLASPVASRPLAGRALRAMLGRDEHRAIADEMARFL